MDVDVHVGVDLGLVRYAGGRQPEGIDGPLEIRGPVVAAQGQAFAQCRFVDLDDADAEDLLASVGF